MQIELSLWEQKVIEFGIPLPDFIPKMPKPTASWGPLGLDLKLTCPGPSIQFCENPQPCFNSPKLPLKIPGFSFSLPIPEINLPPLSVRITVPPKIIVPLFCPIYKGPQTPPA